MQTSSGMGHVDVPAAVSKAIGRGKAPVEARIGRSEPFRGTLMPAEESRLPNYAFPERGVKLDAYIRREGAGREPEHYEWIRSPVSAPWPACSQRHSGWGGCAVPLCAGSPSPSRALARERGSGRAASGLSAESATRGIFGPDDAHRPVALDRCAPPTSSPSAVIFRSSGAPSRRN